MILIINADDYGYNPNCTRAITECLRQGWITNTTLMVNMPRCEEALSQARQYGLVDHIGLHLNIYGGESLTERIRQRATFCGEDGIFNHAFSNGIINCWRSLGAEEKDALAGEVEAQIKRYLELGLPIRHIDSHHHSHMIMRILPTVAQMAEKYGFKTMRRGVNVGARDTLRRKMYYTIQDGLQQYQLAKHHLVTTQYMCDFKNFRSHYSIFGVDDAVELMVHPFYATNGKLDDAGEMSDSGLRPMREVVDFIAAHRSEIKLISYSQLIQS